MPIARETRREAEVLDSFADCMGHEYRRRILFSLYRAGGDALTVPDDLLGEDVERVERDGFLIELAHSHLPKLEGAGYVSWDREAEVVDEGDEFEELEPLLEVLAEHYDRIVPVFDPNQPV